MGKKTQAEIVRDLFLESSIVYDKTIKEALNLKHDNYAAVLQPLRKAGWIIQRNSERKCYHLIKKGDMDVSAHGQRKRKYEAAKRLDEGKKIIAEIEFEDIPDVEISMPDISTCYDSKKYDTGHETNRLRRLSSYLRSTAQRWFDRTNLYFFFSGFCNKAQEILRKSWANL